jgi:hypothetical protein
MRQKTVLSLGDKEQKHISQFVLLLLFLAGEFLFVTLYFASQPSEDSRAIIFGYSLSKFSIIVLLSLVTFAELGATLSVIQGNRLGVFLDGVTSDPKHEIFVIRFLGLLGGICWIIYFIPPRYFHTLEDYIILTSPLLILGVLISCQTIAFILLEKDGKIAALKQCWLRNKKNLMIWAAVSAIFIMVWAFIAISRIGLSANNEDYWYEAGVPVLGWQVLLGLLIGLLFTKLETSAVLGKRLFLKGDLLIFMLIWLVGGFLWAQTPVPNGFLNPGPYPPTYETYPYADAARFDLMSQYALIGQGLNNGHPYNRPAYPAFLVFLHVISGQNYEQNMLVQAAIYGVFPALIYLIAKFLLSRSAGVAVSALIIMRGINGIAATNMINLSSQKQMLTEFPVAIGVASILVMCILWIRHPRKLFLPLLAGGVFGVTFYLRQTILGFFPVVLFLPALRRMQTGKMKVVTALIFLLGVLTVMTPYYLKNVAINPENIYPSVIKKIVSVVEKRYPKTRKEVPPKTNLHDSPISPDLAQNEFLPGDEIVPTGIDNENFILIGTHFLHNIITSVLILPNSFAFENLKASIRAENSFWQASWDGKLNFEQSLILAFNLFLLSLGIVVAVKKQRLVGLLPLIFGACYNFTSALGRTSGGRYIVPSDWIVVLYFIIGSFQACEWLLGMLGLHEKAVDMGAGDIVRSERIEHIYNKVLPVTIGLLLLGTLLILPDFIFPRQFQEITREQLQHTVLKYDLGENKKYLLTLLESDRQTKIWFGKIMYPRYYGAGFGEVLSFFPYATLDYPRLAFYLIGPSDTKNVLLMGPVPVGLKNNSNAIIVGCKEKDHIDAIVIVLTDNPGQSAHFREPLPGTTCPLPEP